MFRIVTGVLGAGKTFYAVNYLKKFCKYDKLYNTMILDSDVLLVTNITDIKVSHLTYDEFRELGLMDIDECKRYVMKFRYRRIIIIIDEAQRYFANLRDAKEFFFFEYSRHLGMDIFLIMQTINAIPRRLAEISEYIIEAQSRTKAIIGFQYAMRDSKNGDVLSRITIKKDTQVFKLYKSFDAAEIDKPKKVLLRKAFVGVCMVLVAALLIRFTITNAFHDEIPNNKTKGNNALVSLPPGPPPPRPPEDLAPPSQQRPLPRPDYIVDPSEIDIRPHGDIVGVSQTDHGTYIFYAPSVPTASPPRPEAGVGGARASGGVVAFRK